MELFADVSSAAPKISLPLLWLLADCHSLYFAPRVLTSLQTLANYLIIGETVPFSNYFEGEQSPFMFYFFSLQYWEAFSDKSVSPLQTTGKRKDHKDVFGAAPLTDAKYFGEHIFCFSGCQGITDGFLDLCYKGLKFCSCCIFTHICSPTHSPSVGINSVKQ